MISTFVDIGAGIIIIIAAGISFYFFSLNKNTVIEESMKPEEGLPPAPYREGAFPDAEHP